MKGRGGSASKLEQPLFTGFVVVVLLETLQIIRKGEHEVSAEEVGSLAGNGIAGCIGGEIIVVVGKIIDVEFQLSLVVREDGICNGGVEQEVLL